MVSSGAVSQLLLIAKWRLPVARHEAVGVANRDALHGAARARLGRHGRRRKRLEAFDKRIDDVGVLRCHVIVLARVARDVPEAPRV